MLQAPRSFDVPRWLGPSLVVAVVYFVGAKLGLSLAFVAEQVTAVWPPTGIALAAVVLVGPRIWPGIALGALVANLTAHATVPAAVGIAVGNTLEALVAGWLLREDGFRPSLERLRDVVALIVRGAAISTAVSATIGVASLCLAGVQPWEAFGKLWSVWWLGDAIGDLVMAPVLLVWASAPFRVRRTPEAVVLVVATAAVTAFVFAAELPEPFARYPLQYLAFPMTVWAAMRFGLRGTVTTTALVSVIAIWSTAFSHGPFATATPHDSLLLLQLFMAVVAITGLVLGAAVEERDAAQLQSADDYRSLERSEERLRLALDAGHMGVWDWNVATGAVTWSENLEPLSGRPAGSFAGTFDAFLEFVHPDDRTSVLAAIQEAIAHDRGFEIEFRNIWPDGSLHWFAGKGRVVRGADGTPLRMLGVGTDVTERRHLEEELRQHVGRLADADRRKDEFLAMLAHELRNPLAPLSNALHLLARDTPERGRFIEMARRQVTHLVRLVDDLLDVSRITRGLIGLKKEPLALADVVARAVEIVRADVDTRGQVFTASLPADEIRVEADPARLAQVLGNLLGNASKYTPPGGSIWLTAERLEHEAVIRVRDTGVGIAPELLPTVFDLFVQGDASLARTRGGLGIGLTIVRRLVEMHGGRVEVRSAGEGQGSEFAVYLPALAQALSVPSSEPRTALPRRSALRILIVEDNHDAAESLATLLELWGHEVELAYDAPSALDAAARCHPDVIVSDIGLPGMDGYELARRLRAEPAFGRVVLIALSGYGRGEDQRRAADAGFDHHLVKPPNLTTLAELLGRVSIAPHEQPPRMTVH